MRATIPTACLRLIWLNWSFLVFVPFSSRYGRSAQAVDHGGGQPDVADGANRTVHHCFAQGKTSTKARNITTENGSVPVLGFFKTKFCTMLAA
jgi:hypothetical protein